MRIGAVLVPLSTLLRPRELQQQLEAASIRHLIASDNHRGRDYRADIAALDRAILPSLSNVWWWVEMKSDAPQPSDVAHAAALEASVQPADDMVVMFTSGSLGAPKGVIHTHGGAIRAQRASSATRCVTEGSRLYLPMPFFWMGGFGTGLISALVAGATLLTEESPEPRKTLAFLQEKRVDLFRGWPDQALQIARLPEFATADLSCLKAGSLDAVLPSAIRAEPGRRSGLFGMTETFGPITGWPLDQDMPEAGWGSLGKVLGEAEMRIADLETQQEAAVGETGALQFRSPNLMRGICGRERRNLFTPDGWFDTGDLGRMDADGFLFFVGRQDDMFKVKGATVYPSEVEEALMSIPGVRRAFATDIDVDGVKAVGAAVLAEADATLDPSALKLAARDRLSAFKLPVRWWILASMEDIPLMGSAKVDKAALRAKVAQGVAA